MPIQPAINQRQLLPDSYLRVLKNCYWAEVGGEKALKDKLKSATITKVTMKASEFTLQMCCLFFIKNGEEELNSVAV